MTEKKRKNLYIIAAVICMILGLLLKKEESVEKLETNPQIAQTSEIFASEVTEPVQEDYVAYYFRNEDLLEQHFKKHGMEMGFESMQAYEEAASAVVYHPDVLTKTEAEDGDYVYYIEETNEFVVISTDGYIRTYFNPSAGIDYYNRQ